MMMMMMIVANHTRVRTTYFSAHTENCNQLLLGDARHLGHHRLDVERHLQFHLHAECRLAVWRVLLQNHQLHCYSIRLLQCMDIDGHLGRSVSSIVVVVVVAAAAAVDDALLNTILIISEPLSPFVCVARPDGNYCSQCLLHLLLLLLLLILSTRKAKFCTSTYYYYYNYHH